MTVPEPTFPLDNLTHPRVRTRVLRFTLSERTVHWIVAAAFFSMLISGLLMGRPRNFQNFTYTWHIVSAAVMVGGLLAVVLGGNRRALRTTGRELRRLDAFDRAWLARAPLAAIRRSSLPPAGRFNGGQKMNFLLLSTLLFLLAVSGLGLLITGSPAIPVLKVAHVGSAYLSALLVLGHLYMAIINPSTRPALRGIITGTVDAAWVRRHHTRGASHDTESVSTPIP
jgi:formate dehydrogenase subunit gamma